MKDLPKYQTWFSIGVFVLSFAAIIFLLVYDIPPENREMASNAQGFLQGSLCMSAINFLLGGNPKQNKPTIENATTTATFEATVTTEPKTTSDDGQDIARPD